MLRFVLLTCWLIGAGGGWGLGLAGLNAMGTGAGSYAELIMLGGASSWAAMLVTALRPGKRPNIWQRIFTVLAWLMPVGMFMLGDSFNLNVRLFSVAAAACVTMIVIIYPSQSPQIRVDEGRRLALHVRKQEAEQKAARKREGDGAQLPEAADSEGVAGALAGASVGEATPTPAVPPSRASPPEPSASHVVPNPEPTRASESARDGWAPRTPEGTPRSGPDEAAGLEDAESASSSRWETPQVRRRGKLRDDRTGVGSSSPEGRGS